MAIGLLLAALDARALWDGRLEPFVVQTAVGDDNVFRLPQGVDPLAALGTNSAGDVYHTTALGLAFDLSTGAQRFRGDLQLDRYQFNRFDALDHDGHRADVDWEWKPEDALVTHLGHTQSLALASLSNIQGGSRSTTPNLIDSRRTYVNATYAPAPRWLVSAELGTLDQSNSAAVYLASDLRASTTEIEFAYVTPAATRIGLEASSIDGHLPNRQLVGSQLIDNSYEQHSVAAFIDWQTSNHSRLDARVGHVQRSYPELGARGHSGSIYRAAYEWQPRDRLTLTATAVRDISATEEVNVGFVLVESVGLHAHLRATDRLDMLLDLERYDRAYRGDPVTGIGLAPQPAEQVRVSGLAAVLRLTPIVTLDFRLRRERRSSNVAFETYAVGIVSVGARIAF